MLFNEQNKQHETPRELNSTHQSNAKPSVAGVHNEECTGMSISLVEQEALEAPLVTKGTDSGETTQRL
jgi:hypothetical protein